VDTGKNVAVKMKSSLRVTAEGAVSINLSS
jgi:hypothetical protein